jgi:hypothetical protein
MLPQFQELRILMEAMDPDFIACFDANNCGNLMFFFVGFWFSSSAIVQIARKSCASGKSFEQ